MAISLDYDELEREYTITVEKGTELLFAAINRDIESAQTAAELFLIEFNLSFYNPTFDDGFKIY